MQSTVFMEQGVTYSHYTMSKKQSKLFLA